MEEEGRRERDKERQRNRERNRKGKEERYEVRRGIWMEVGLLTHYLIRFPLLPNRTFRKSAKPKVAEEESDDGNWNRRYQEMVTIFKSTLSVNASSKVLLSTHTLSLF